MRPQRSSSSTPAATWRRSPVPVLDDAPHGMVAAEVESEHARRAWFRLRHAAG